MRNRNGIGLALLLALFAAGGCKSDPGSGDARERERRASALVDAMAAGNASDARKDFNLIMRMSLSEGRLEQVWEGLVAQAGSFTNRLWTSQARQAGYEIVWIGLGFERGGMKAKVVFDSGDKVTGLFFQPWHEEAKPADYVDATRFHEQEVRFGKPGWELDGTLTLPKGVTNVPSLVLVHGSGPNDRDETVGANKPFRDLAWGLAGRGIAVFRYEKRTKAHQAKMSQLRTLTVREETVDDAVLAAEFLGGRAEVDRSRVHVLGHSLGAHLGPRIAVRAKRLAGLILLAGNVRSLPELIVDQTEYLSSEGGDKEGLKGLRLAADRVRELSPADEKSREVVLGAPMSYWFDLRDYDPVKTLEAFSGPILILHGERDYQVPMKDFELWKAGLAGRPNVTARSFPALNHLMISGTGRSTPFEYETAGHVAGDVIDAIAEWIKD